MRFRIEHEPDRRLGVLDQVYVIVTGPGFRSDALPFLEFEGPRPTGDIYVMTSAGHVVLFSEEEPCTWFGTVLCEPDGRRELRHIVGEPDVQVPGAVEWVHVSARMPHQSWFAVTASAFPRSPAGAELGQLDLLKEASR